MATWQLRRPGPLHDKHGWFGYGWPRDLGYRPAVGDFLEVWDQNGAKNASTYKGTIAEVQRFTYTSKDDLKEQLGAIPSYDVDYWEKVAAESGVCIRVRSEDLEETDREPCPVLGQRSCRKKPS